MCHSNCPVDEAVPADALTRIDDDLVRAAGLDDERGAVGVERPAAVCAPACFAGGGVEIQQIRCRIVIADEDERIVEQRWRTAVPPVDVERAVLTAEMARPDQFPVRVERDQLARSEPGIDVFAVGDGAGRGEVVLVMDVVQPSFGRHRIFPELASVGAPQRGDEKRDRFAARCRRDAAEGALTRVDGAAALDQRRVVSGAPVAAAYL